MNTAVEAQQNIFVDPKIIQLAGKILLYFGNYLGIVHYCCNQGLGEIVHYLGIKSTDFTAAIVSKILHLYAKLYCLEESNPAAPLKTEKESASIRLLVGWISVTN